MLSKDDSKLHKEENEQGFPIEAKLLLLVIALGVLVVILKAAGVL